VRYKPAGIGMRKFPVELNFCLSRLSTALTLGCCFLYPASAAQGNDPVRDQIMKICEAPGDGGIPDLRWTKRSDWISVKTDVEPAAKGDGVADDSAAIQAALDQIGERPGDPKVVYLPPGKYRISRTLSLTRRVGGMVVGHGRHTTLVWAGEANGRMFWSNGAAYHVFQGLVWDGDGKAGVGIDHDSKTLYETRVLHKHMEFRNFRLAGIRVGHDQKLASAEMMFVNVLFRDNAHGVMFLAWNDYNNVFDGAHFLDNGTGIYVEKGNVVVRNVRFERSKHADLVLSTHSHSIRRVVSEGSHTFIETVSGPQVAGAITVQDCQVSGWSNREGAILARLRGPVTVFDCVFAGGPNDYPPIKLAHPRSTIQTALLSNVMAPGARAVIDPGLTGRVQVVPPGRLGGTLTSTRDHFLRSDVVLPEQVLDAREDCLARGDGTHDDSDRIQDCLNRADRGKPGTLVYFPSGRYLVSSTIQVRGTDYRLGGAGFHSQIQWGGASGGEVLRVQKADNIWIEDLAVGGPEGVTRVHHTGDHSGAVRYNGVYGWTDVETVPNAFLFDDFRAGTLVVAGHLDGTQVFRNITPGTLLVGNAISTHTRLEGSAAAPGTVWVLSRVSCCADYPLVVQDNQSLIMTDWYNEQSMHLFRIAGAPDSIQGRVTLDLKEAHAKDPVVLTLSGYHGRVSFSGGFFRRWQDDTPQQFVLTDGQDTTLSIFGSMFWRAVPQFRGDRGVRPYLRGNIVDARFDPMALVPEEQGDKNLSAIVGALDDFRQLGRLDRMLNYCVAEP